MDNRYSRILEYSIEYVSVCSMCILHFYIGSQESIFGKNIDSWKFYIIQKCFQKCIILEYSVYSWAVFSYNIWMTRVHTQSINIWLYSESIFITVIYVFSIQYLRIFVNTKTYYKWVELNYYYGNCFLIIYSVDIKHYIPVMRILKCKHSELKY